MKNLITKEQRDEIVHLANAGHSGALVAFGGDLYREGLKDGIAIGVWCISMSIMTYKALKGLRDIKKKHKRN